MMILARRTSALAALFIVLVALPARAQTTALVIHSTPGDPVGQGLTWTYDGSNASFSHLNLSVGVSLEISQSNLRWGLDFRAGGSLPLTQGTYLGAVPSGAGNGFEPHMGIGRTGGGPYYCPRLTGRLDVRELVTASDGSLL